MIHRSSLLWIALLLVLTPARGRAGGGGDHTHAHDDEPARAVGPQHDDEHRAAAASSDFELVAVWPASESSGELPVRLFLSDFATNAPIEEASIELSFLGPAEVAATAAATGSPGVYEARIRFPALGHYALAAAVVADERVDALAIEDFDVGPHEEEGGHDPGEAHEHDHAHERDGVLVALGLLVAIAAVAFGLRRRGSGPAMLALLALPPGAARAHGGEDHDHAPAPAAVVAPVGAKIPLAKESQFLLGVRTVVVEPREVTPRLRVPGRVVAPPDRHAPIHPTQAGRLLPPAEGFPRLGERVRKGRPLAILDAALSAGERASFSVEAAQAASRETAAAARVEAASRQRARLAELTGVTSRAELEAAEVELRAAEAELEAARGARRAYAGPGGGATRTVIVSPIDGVIADVAASPGELVEPARRVFLVLDPRELWVEASVFEGDVGRVEKARAALVGVEAWPELRFEASLLATGQVVDPATRAVKAVFRVPNPEGRLKLGMFAEVEIEAGAGRSALVVPASAVVDAEGRKLVYVHTEPEVFEAREVALGRRDGAFLEVQGGLIAGERVVVDGAYALRHARAAR